MRPVAQNGHHWLTENNLRLEAEGALNLPSSPPPQDPPFLHVVRFNCI